MTKAAVRTASRAPFALVLVTALLLTTVWSRTHPVDADGVFAWVSTNVHNLTHSPIRVLVLSTLFLPSGHWLNSAIVLVAVLVPLERRFGTMRTLVIFASAHVLATLLTEGWEYAAIHVGALPRSAIFQEDVGVSYGMYGAAAAACVLVPRRWRIQVTGLLAVYLLVPLALDPGMTTTGHVLSLLIGLAWWPVLSRQAAKKARADGATAASPACEPVSELV